MRTSPSGTRRDGRATRFANAVRRFISDERGQDIVEYAFLAAFIGIAGWAALMVIDEAVANTYETYLDPESGVPSLWEPPEPLGSSGP